MCTRASKYALRVSKSGATLMAVLKNIHLQFFKTDMPTVGIKPAEAPYMGVSRRVIGAVG
jgi:hypothetical protein